MKMCEKNPSASPTPRRILAENQVDTMTRKSPVFDTRELEDRLRYFVDHTTRSVQPEDGSWWEVESGAQEISGRV